MNFSSYGQDRKPVEVYDQLVETVSFTIHILSYEQCSEKREPVGLRRAMKFNFQFLRFHFVFSC